MDPGLKPWAWPLRGGSAVRSGEGGEVVKEFACDAYCVTAEIMKAGLSEQRILWFWDAAALGAGGWILMREGMEMQGKCLGFVQKYLVVGPKFK
jgi:hypothetical protein